MYHTVYHTPMSNKGITERFAALVTGETSYVEGLERPSLHTIAARTRIKVSIRRKGQGFQVTKRSDICKDKETDSPLTAG